MSEIKSENRLAISLPGLDLKKSYYPRLRLLWFWSRVCQVL